MGYCALQWLLIQFGKNKQIGLFGFAPIFSFSSKQFLERPIIIRFLRGLLPPLVVEISGRKSSGYIDTKIKTY